MMKSKIKSVSLARPGVGVGIKIFNQDKKILIGKRLKEGLYGYPGGHLEMFESWEHCARRELQEETGIKIPLEAFKNIRVTNVIQADKNYHYIEITMAAKLPLG